MAPFPPGPFSLADGDFEPEADEEWSEEAGLDASPGAAETDSGGEEAFVSRTRARSAKHSTAQHGT